MSEGRPTTNKINKEIIMYIRNNKCTRTKPSSQGRGEVLAGQSRRESDLEQRLKGTKGGSKHGSGEELSEDR